MDERSQRAFELAAALYRLAKLCPEGDILVAKIKESALNILADFIKRNIVQAEQEIKVLQGFFKLARLQGWVNIDNFEVLERGYASLTESKKTQIIFRPARPKASEAGTGSSSGLSQRQQEILDFLSTKQEFRLKEVKEAFLKVSDKTLRNDLKTLVIRGFLRRAGQGAGSVYKVIR